MYLYGIEIKNKVNRNAFDLVLIVPLWNWNIEGALNSHRYWVLIVPLWNWNKGNKDGYDKGYNGSNCTFMELKSLNEYNFSLSDTVLIVPLWNWNDKRPTSCHNPNKVLIVPLWNWNYLGDYVLVPCRVF